MILIRTPLRVDFMGGSTDIEYFYSKYVGHVLNAAINKYVYVAVHPRYEDGLRMTYDTSELVGHAANLNHARARAALEKHGIDSGLDIISISDIPTHGSGL